MSLQALGRSISCMADDELVGLLRGGASVWAGRLAEWDGEFDLERASLAGVDLSGIELQGADLTEARLAWGGVEWRGPVGGMPGWG